MVTKKSKFRKIFREKFLLNIIGTMEILEIKKSPKNYKIYSCEFCDYDTCNYKDYKKHLSTQKHKKGILEINGNKKSPKKKIYFLVIFVTKFTRLKVVCGNIKRFVKKKTIKK